MFAPPGLGLVSSGLASGDHLGEHGRRRLKTGRVLLTTDSCRPKFVRGGSGKLRPLLCLRFKIEDEDFHGLADGCKLALLPTTSPAEPGLSENAGEELRPRRQGPGWLGKGGVVVRRPGAQPREKAEAETSQ